MTSCFPSRSWGTALPYTNNNGAAGDFRGHKIDTKLNTYIYFATSKGCLPPPSEEGGGLGRLQALETCPYKLAHRASLTVQLRPFGFVLNGSNKNTKGMQVNTKYLLFDICFLLYLYVLVGNDVNVWPCVVAAR